MPDDRKRLPIIPCISHARRAVLIAFHKPYDVLSQFTRELPEHRTLADYGLPKDVYPIGRLDRDSEGLLLLSDEKPLVDWLLNPRHEHPRTYCVQVEGIPDESQMQTLQNGTLQIQGHRVARAVATVLHEEPVFAPRHPPIRFRAAIPTSWIQLTLTEGKNRQVRRMTAAVGLPTLRLVRVAIGDLQLHDLPPGTWKHLSAEDRKLLGV
jgi:23S rRNA pseudouridine2457 synthase